MKNYTYLMLAIALLTVLGTSAQTPELGNAEAAQAMMKKAQNLQKDIDRLKALEPLTKEQLLLMLPETLGELKRTEHFAGDEVGMGIISVTGTYSTIGEPEFVDTGDGGEIPNKKNKTFSFSVTDGAGPGAPIFASMLMTSDLNFTSVGENDEITPVTVNGIKGRQKYNNKTIHTSIYFIYLDRFSISATGAHLTPEETSAYFEKFDLGILSPKN